MAQGVAVYNLYGVKVGQADTFEALHLPAGIYIERSASGSRKVLVK